MTTRADLIKKLAQEHGVGRTGTVYMANKGECSTCDEIRKLRAELRRKSKRRTKC